MPPPFKPRAVAELGGLDILLNNAGILRLSEVKDISLEDIDATLNVNVRAPIIASKAAIPHLGQGGRIINIGSFFADRVPGGAGLPVYALSKSALSVWPGNSVHVTAQSMWCSQALSTQISAHGPFGETLRSLTALGRYSVVGDIADAVAFLASTKARYITGAALTVDGGANA